MSQPAQRKRLKFGVIATIDVSRSEIVLVMNDAELKGEGAADWSVIRFFTERSYDRDRFISLKLTKSQFEDIGIGVVARLCALGRLEPSPQAPRKTAGRKKPPRR